MAGRNLKQDPAGRTVLLKTDCLRSRRRGRQDRERVTGSDKHEARIALDINEKCACGCDG